MKHLVSQHPLKIELRQTVCHEYMEVGQRWFSGLIIVNMPKCTVHLVSRLHAYWDCQRNTCYPKVIEYTDDFLTALLNLGICCHGGRCAGAAYSCVFTQHRRFSGNNPATAEAKTRFHPMMFRMRYVPPFIFITIPIYGLTTYGTPSLYMQVIAFLMIIPFPKGVRGGGDGFAAKCTNPIS